MTAKRRVLVVGAGIAGAVTANNLVKYGLDVTVVEPSEHHVYQPGLVDYLVGDARTDEIIRPVDSVLNKGVKLVRDKVVKVDLKDRKVMTSGGKELSYDYLVLAPGRGQQGLPLLAHAERDRSDKEVPGSDQPEEGRDILQAARQVSGCAVRNGVLD